MNNNVNEWINILKKHNHLYVFGTSEVGRRLVSLIFAYGFGDKFRGYVETKKSCEMIESFPVYSINEFDGINDSESRAIIMSISDSYHADVYKMVARYFSDCINSIKYYALPIPKENRWCIGFEDKDISKEKEHIRTRICERYFQNMHAFGENRFYQSFPMLGIPGMRPTDYRIDRYGIKDYLSKEKSVLDIGCNCGFFDMEIANCVSRIVALEYDETMSKFSEETAIDLGIENVCFIPGDFNKWSQENSETFDVILSFAVHIWIGMTPKAYALTLSNILRSGGTLLFESQDYNRDNRYDDFCKEFVESGLKRIKDDIMMDDGVNLRKFTYFSK